MISMKALHPCSYIEVCMYIYIYEYEYVGVFHMPAESCLEILMCSCVYLTP